MDVDSSEPSVDAAANQVGAGHRMSGSTVAILAVVAAAAGVGLMVALRAIIFTPDSIPYIATARDIAAGRGITLPYGSISPAGVGAPVGHWPPGYPLLLSVEGHAMLTWARALGIAFLTANVFLFGMLALRLGVKRSLAIVVALVFAGAAFQIHGTAESEPLFLFLLLVGLHGLVTFFERRTLLSLGVVAVALGLATVTRYAGEAFIIGGVLAILFLLEGPIRERLVYGAALGVVANIPLGIWVLSIQHAPRSAAIHHPGLTELKEALYTISSFIVPVAVPTIVRVLLVMVIVLALVVLVMAGQQSRPLSEMGEERIDAMLVLLAVVYLVFVLVSRTFFDSQIPFDTRLFFPAFILVLLWGARAWSKAVAWSTVFRSPWATVIGVSLIASVLLASVWTAVDTARHTQNKTFAFAMWRDDGLIRAVNALPRDTIVYSNGPDVMYYLTGRPIHALPYIMSGRAAFAADMATIRTGICGRQAVIAYWTTRATRVLQPSVTRLAHDLKVADITAVTGGRLVNLDTSPPC